MIRVAFGVILFLCLMSLLDVKRSTLKDVESFGYFLVVEQAIDGDAKARTRLSLLNRKIRARNDGQTHLNALLSKGSGQMSAEQRGFQRE